MLQREILTSEIEIEAIADEWRQLHARAGRSPVTDYDRFRAWWDTIGKREGPSSLHIVVGRCDGKLAAVLPLVVMRKKKILRMLREPDGMTFECDLLTEDPGYAAAMWQAVRRSRHYDFAKIKGIYPKSVSYEILRSFARQSDEVESFYLHFNWPTGQDWLMSLSGNTRGNFRRCTRRMEDKGPVRYEIYKSGPLPKAIIDGMVKHKVAWCAARGKRGLFEQPNVAAYFQRFAETAAAQGNLFLAWMECGSTVVAYSVGLVYQGILYAYLWTYDPVWSQCSPGNVVMVNSICWAIDHGLKGLDFIYTTESESEKYFKSKYCSEVRPCYEFTFSSSLAGHLIEAAFVGLRAVWRLTKRRESTVVPEGA